MAQPPTLADRPDLVTERLVLRRPDERDIDAIVGIVSDWDVASRLARVPHPYGPADARFFLDEVVPGEWVWAITMDADQRLIGAVGLAPGADRSTADLGYWLARPFWSRGVMTEAAGAVLSFGFDTLHLAHVTAGHMTDNPGSGRVLEKLGFVRTGQAMQPCLARGVQVPVARLDLRAEQWRGAPTPLSSR